jgi:hypothetical protein
MSADRRNFLRWTLGGVAGLAVVDAAALRAATPANVMADEPWLAAIAAKKNKALLDVMHFFPDGTPYRRAKTLMTILHGSYGVEEKEIGIAVGFHSAGLAHVLSQSLWDDMGLAEWLSPQLSENDRAALTKGAGTFAAAGAASVTELRGLGFRVLACRETIGSWARRVAAQKGEQMEAVRERILQGLHPGVEPVPAMIAATFWAQERGARYVAVA